MIGRAPQEVFAYLAAFENVPRWNPAIVETEKTTDGPVGVGTTYRQVRSMPTPAVEAFTITHFEPATELAIEGTIGPFEATLSYRLSPSPGGTILTNDAHLEGGRVATGVGPLIARRIAGSVADNLATMKRLLEDHVDDGHD
jgi:hypothetical protein